MTGMRADNEDRWKVAPIFGTAVFVGVFDGHGGSFCAEYAKEHLYKHLLKVTDDTFVSAAHTELCIMQAFRRCDAELLDLCEKNNDNSGTTASIAVVTDQHVFAASVGDSRIVMSRNGKAVALSEDHKACNFSEAQRIHDHGGEVTVDPYTNISRVMGMLAVSRTLGNKNLRQYGVIAEPECVTVCLEARDQFLLLGSDGVFDVVSNQEAVDLVKSTNTMREAASALVDLAFEYNSHDNATAVVVRLPGWSSEKSLNYTDLLREYNLDEIFFRKTRTTPEWLMRELDKRPSREHLVHMLFEMFDHNRDGTLSREDVATGMELLGHRLSSDDLDFILTISDVDGDGMIGWKEFLQNLTPKAKNRGISDPKPKSLANRDPDPP